MIFKTNLTMNSDLLEIKKEIENLLEQITGFINGQDLLLEIKLILNELILNSAIHGNELNEEKKVELELEIDKNSMKLKIRDEGKGFLYDKTNYDPLELKASGRGLIIVDGLSDEFCVKENMVSVVKYL